MGDVLREERQNLIQREMLLETVLESTPTAIVLTQRDRVIFSNRSARELFDLGARGGRLEGKLFAHILDECPPALREVLAGGRDSLLSLEPAGQADAEIFHVARRSFELNGQAHDLTMISG